MFRIWMLSDCQVDILFSTSDYKNVTEVNALLFAYEISPILTVLKERV